MQALAQQSMLSDCRYCRYCRYYSLASLEVHARSRKSRSRELPPGEEPQDALPKAFFDTSDAWRSSERISGQSHCSIGRTTSSSGCIAMQQLAISNQQLATASF